MGNATVAQLIRNGASEEEIRRALSGRNTATTAGPTTQRLTQGATQTPYQAALGAYTPQRYTFWNGGRTNDGWKIDNSQSAMWQQIKSMYDSGDVAGAMNLVNELSGKGLFSGFYDDQGNYTGFVQGYTGSANASMQPVVGGKLLSSGQTDTNIWLTPDGKALNGTTGGALTDTGSTWSRYQPNQGTGWSWKDAQEQNGMNWGDAYAIRAAHGDFTNPELNTPEGNARAAGTSSPAGGSSGGYTPTAGQTPYQQALSYEAWKAQNGGGSTPSAQPMTAPVAYDPNSDPLWQQYLAQYGNAQAPEYAGDPYQAQRDAALAAYGEKWQGSEYQPLRDEYLRRAAEMEWNYDPNSDPVWQALQKQYRREGQRATEDTLGRYAAITGGMPSTAAVSAAQQAGNRYAAELSDRLPQVYQDAYNRYLQEYQRQLGISDAYAGFDDREYSRWRDQQGKNLDLANAYNQYGQRDYNEYLNALDQWNRDRSFAYGAARDNQQMGRQQVEDQYSRARDAIADQRWDAQWAQQLREYADSQNWKATEWAQYLREYGDKLSQQEREWAYQQMRDAVSDARYEDTTAYQRSLDAWQRQQEEAQMAAKYGDYSGLQGMGIDTSAARNSSYAYAPDGSTYDFSTQKAQSFVTDAPNGSTMRGSDGSIWRKDEYGGVTIEKNGKIYTYSAGQVPAQASTGSTGSGSRSSGSGSSGGGSSDLYVDELIAAGITDPDMAIQWLDRKYPKMTVQTKNAVVNSLTKALGGNEGPSSEDKTWARGIMEGVAKGQYNEDSWVAQRAKEILGIEEQTGQGSSANVEGQSAGYRNLDETLGRMVSRGASRDELYVEIDAEVKDGRITKEQGAALKEKYYGQADNIENSGQYHSGGRPMSTGFNRTMQQAERMASMGSDQASVGALSDFLMEAYNAGKIHEYEIDIILDRLGF